ncbi:MAG: Brp/Blh family beta-carotene 15,15'-dioxygenase [Planctomycetota bacterium]|nr:Brp/Blh family beta-carotene 15,15'-dioxygenase [Planctomycetota bacterium]
MKHTLIFCAAALAAITASAALNDSWPGLELFVVAAAVIVLGVPHGALDVVHAARSLKLRSPSRWLWFTASYLAVAAAVVGAWIWAPSVSLAIFLAISAFHFSGDLQAGTPLPMRALHGASPIILPALLHPDELSTLFAMLVPAAGAEALAGGLAAAAPVALTGLILCLVAAAAGHLAGRLRSAPKAAIAEAAATGALTVLAPPLTAFAVYFCVLHSARHVLRTRGVFQLPARDLWRAAALPTLATAAAAPVAFYALDHATVDARTLQVIFIGLAALTVPHMMLIEPLRLRGWRA